MSVTEPSSIKRFLQRSVTKSQDVAALPRFRIGAGDRGRRLVAGDEMEGALSADIVDLAMVGSRAANRTAARLSGTFPDIKDPDAGATLRSAMIHADAIPEGAARTTWLFAAPKLAKGLIKARPTDPIQLLDGLTGALAVGLALSGHAAIARAATTALTRLAQTGFTNDGTLVSRAPDQLADMFARLVWAAEALPDPPPPLIDRISILAASLRGLRLGDGRLTRIHGSGIGDVAHLDQALARSGTRHTSRPKLTMGVARLAAGRAIVLIDCAPPPAGRLATQAHAGTLGFEMSAGRKPILIHQGPGDMAMRDTAGHTAVSIARMPSSGFARKGRTPALLRPPAIVTCERAIDRVGQWLLASHDGYVPGFGLTHERRLFLAPNGEDLRGEDTLSAQSSRDQAKLATRLAEGSLTATARFHVHPGIVLERRDEDILLYLPNGHIWSMWHSEPARLLPSLYTAHRDGHTRDTMQIVIDAQISDMSARVNWVFRRIA